MRIIAGRFKGQEIKTPKNASTTRPTTDRTKEAIFSHLESMGMLDNTRVADIYAGTGALGFEALSRGAASVTFVESNAQIARLIAQTAQSFKGPHARELSIKIIRAQAEKYTQKVAGSAELFDLVFMDPPYAVETDTVNEQIARISTTLSTDGVLMVERSIRSTDISAPEGFEIYLRKDYGETEVFYIRSLA
ncbi:16S rRNA (guanine(966)-N(2))-methyltransferase RsmD [Alloscardovia theropitheci]|uniref:16S rRNA (Guanine(966)-N(2))-methyltransferase RsmD n=1 Tax=Alloscardovia theropitheci TaxID=2496842 RepID=A0A4V2MU20_9BIFI|nr:16S rRNA (guanine(966)-N(2))-methyltransferase RsmD [Alloscardovia theropitheci]TCD54679.1 16S rRNA (guanine(966)-N(2))-methyltransferase RsmD [Alloscardovia theropitheci]